MTQRNSFNKEVNTKDEDKKIEEKSFFLGTSLFFTQDFTPLTEFLNEDDAITMSFVSKEFDKQDSPYRRIKNNNIQKLFKLISKPTEENIKEAKRMVERNYTLLLMKMPTHVFSGQELEVSFSALQRIAYYGDFFLAESLLAHLPVAANSIAAAQLKKVVTGNDGFLAFLAPYRNLIDGYKKYSDQYNTLEDARNWTKLTELWLDLIGKRQSLLPEFALQQFCSSTLFYPLPSFDKEPPRRACQLHDGTLFDRNSLGVDFALYRGDSYFGSYGFDEAGPPRRGWPALLWWLDMKALEHLCKVIESKFGSIIKKLDPTFRDTSTYSPCIIL